MLVKSKRPISSGKGKRPEERTVDELLEDGVVVIDKPAGPTSHQVTSWVGDMVGAKSPPTEALWTLESRAFCRSDWGTRCARWIRCTTGPRHTSA